jgi:hypothetical protein
MGHDFLKRRVSLNETRVFGAAAIAQTKSNSQRKTQTPVRPPLIVSSRVLGVLGAPLVPVNSICYR